MTNDFATISAESELRDQITLTPSEQDEANQWFDDRAEGTVQEMEDRWLDSYYESRFE